VDKKQLAADFNVTAKFYELENFGELETAKDAVRADPENAAISYAAMAKEIAA
jgi:hypothetical protein